MKLTNIGLLFSLIFLCFLIIDDLRCEELKTIANLQIKYNNALDNAALDSLSSLVEVDSVRQVFINKEEAVKRFFTSLTIYMEGLENIELQNRLRIYVPVIGILLEDGFYLSYLEEKKENGELVEKPVFTEKFYYEKKEGEYQIRFTISEFVSVLNTITGENLEGKYQDVREVFPCESFRTAQIFDETRRHIIVSCIKENLNIYINQHNKIAKKYGIQYEFSIPNIEMEDWYRTIDDMGILAFFQGYPYGNGITGYYNRVAFAGARLHKMAPLTEQKCASHTLAF